MPTPTKVIRPLSLLLFLGWACGGDDPKPVPDGGREGEEEICEHQPVCMQRKHEAFNPNQPSFRSDVLRWACADTATIEGKDRGQEYCEYFAIVRLGTPGGGALAEPTILGSVFPIDTAAKETGSDLAVKPHLRDRKYGSTPPGLNFTPEQRTWLEQDPTREVGQCIFTSWNQDATAPLPCELDPTLEHTTVTGVHVGKEMFQMKFETNSNEAAQALLEDCSFGGNQDLVPDDAIVVPQDRPLTPEEEAQRERESAGAEPGVSTPVPFPEEGTEAPENGPEMFEEVEVCDDPDVFTRGCYLNAGFNQTQHRKSDSVLCASAMRMAECGCDSTTPVKLPELLSPKKARGFPLGSWARADALPPGCQYLDIHDDSQTLVTCALSAADVLRGSTDVKHLCREKYGPDVVVHVPVPGANIRCDASKGNPAYSADCAARPWVVEANW